MASAFGTAYYWGDSVQQTPGVRDYIITDLESQVDTMTVPDVCTEGWLPEGLKRIRMFAEAGEGLIPVSLLDAAGGINVAADLMGMTELLLATKTMPQALHQLLGIIQDLYIAVIRAGIESAGGEDNITTTDFPDIWFPEGYKGHVSDDVSAAMKHSLKGKGFIYLYWDGSVEPVHWYRDIMELMAPDVIVVPILSFQTAGEASSVFRKLMPTAQEYVKRPRYRRHREEREI